MAESGGAQVTLPGGKKVPKRAVLVVAGVAGVYVAYRYMSAGSAAVATDASTVTAADTGAGWAGSYGTGGGGGAYAGGSGIVGGSTVQTPVAAPLGTSYSDPTTAPLTDNTSWAQRATSWAISLGYDPQTVAEAVGRYLAGTDVAGDRNLLTGIIGSVGTPPQGGRTFPVVTPTPATPPTAGQPATPATPAAAPLKSVTVTSPAPASINTFKASTNYTLDSIARRYSTTVAALKAWNPSLANASSMTVVNKGSSILVRPK